MVIPFYQRLLEQLEETPSKKLKPLLDAVLSLKTVIEAEVWSLWYNI